MNITLKRFSDNGNSTAGLLFIDGEFECFTLEDEFRQIKLKGETRIPAGEYELMFNQLITPMTENYRSRYQWFDRHLMLIGVKGFENIYIHIGNFDTDSEGCILLGDTCDNNKVKKGFIGSSRNAFKRFYLKVSKALETEKIKIKVMDEKEWN